ncbi:hypothetical protein AB0A63_23115 [Lentzea sp. NPDC042327]|uniref:WXG100 family type VII secretion target n=1 Tax=Lentzea sp. NPDC042327 TaxID=3154801 RepID=UPI00340A849E
MTGYDADLGRLDAGAGELRGFAAQAGEVTGALEKTLSALGACWGDDAAGRSFADSHVGPANSTAAALTSVATTFGGVGDKFAKTAETYRHVEESNATAMRRLDG